VKFEIEDKIVSKLLGSMLSGPPWRLGELTENPFAAPEPTLALPVAEPFPSMYADAMPAPPRARPTTAAVATTFLFIKRFIIWSPYLGIEVVT
jgi:hypothetical protein